MTTNDDRFRTSLECLKSELTDLLEQASMDIDNLKDFPNYLRAKVRTIEAYLRGRGIEPLPEKDPVRPRRCEDVIRLKIGTP